MAAYQQFIWESSQPSLASLAEEKKVIVLTFQQEVYALGAQQVQSSRHIADCAAKYMAAAASLRRHVWFRSTGLSEDT